jgi:superfamily II DNA or RNA helicase
VRRRRGPTRGGAELHPSSEKIGTCLPFGRDRYALCRDDQQNLSEVFETNAYSLTLFDLIKQGWLCNVRVRTLPVGIGLSKVRIEEGDFSEKDLGKALAPTLETLADIVAKEYRDRKLIAFCPVRETSGMWTKALLARGLPASHVAGNSKNRKTVLRSLHPRRNPLPVHRLAPDGRL